MLIYLAVNQINQKVYVGQTINSLKLIMWYHKRDALNYNKISHFYYAIRKYGFENFSFIVIDRAQSIEELNNKEKFWIRYYQSFIPKYGYNSTTGGYNKIMRVETKEKLSKAMTGINNPFYGCTHNVATRTLISKVHKGKTLSPEHIRALQTKNSRKFSKEHILKIKKSLTGIKRTDEFRMKIKLSHCDCSGENNSQAVLNSHQVIDIIKQIKTGASIPTIAGQYGVSNSCIRDIKHNRSWRVIPR